MNKYDRQKLLKDSGFSEEEKLRGREVCFFGVSGGKNDERSCHYEGKIAGVIFTQAPIQNQKRAASAVDLIFCDTLELLTADAQVRLFFDSASNAWKLQLRGNLYLGTVQLKEEESPESQLPLGKDRRQTRVLP